MAGYWAAGEILSSSPNPFIFMLEDDDDDFYHYDSFMITLMILIL